MTRNFLTFSNLSGNKNDTSYWSQEKVKHSWNQPNYVTNDLLNFYFSFLSISYIYHFTCCFQVSNLIWRPTSDMEKVEKDIPTFWSSNSKFLKETSPIFGKGNPLAKIAKNELDSLFSQCNTFAYSWFFCNKLIVTKQTNLPYTIICIWIIVL